jgi:cytochrome c oxidase assembly protein subunit 19
MLDLKISTCGSLLMFYRNLMAKDEFKNLGFGEDKAQVEPKKDLDEKGKKGELRW